MWQVSNGLDNADLDHLWFTIPSDLLPSNKYFQNKECFINTTQTTQTILDKPKSSIVTSSQEHTELINSTQASKSWAVNKGGWVTQYFDLIPHDLLALPQF